MNKPKIVFAIYDRTSYRCLSPIASALSDEAAVEYLLLDDLLKIARQPLPLEELKPYRRASDYVRHRFFEWLNDTQGRRAITKLIIQRIIEDDISHHFAYDIEGYIGDAELDLFVTAHDIAPFLKHLIEESHARDFKSAVIQHGINRPSLENPSKIPGVPYFLTPTFGSDFNLNEYYKRKIGYSYGSVIFGNPYADQLYTFGEYFSEHMTKLRSEYPCFGKTNVITAGSPEFNPTKAETFNSEIKSALFLSQWQYENENWSDAEQNRIVERLSGIEEHNPFSITVRPHPKDSDKKMESFFQDFRISREKSLEDDIRSHDLIITVDSTALLRGVLDGKYCAIIQTPWDPITFPPFTHDHIIQITGDENVVQTDAVSRETQIDYLTKFCYVPSLDPDCPHTTPVELISEELLSLVE